MSGACNCGCSGNHSEDCPQFQALTGTLAGMLSGADACGATQTNNGPVLSIQCSLGSGLAGIVDRAGKLKAMMGLAPYRVFLVWEQRVDSELFTEVRRIELMPVEMRGLNEVRITLGPDGRAPDGQVLLVGISPRQVTQDDLLGNMNGKAWDGDGERFFYESRLHERCAGRTTPTPWRWAVDGVPELRTGRNPYGWMIRLTNQRGARGRQGEDRTTNQGELSEGSIYDELRS